MSAVQIVAIGAAILIACVAAFQLALAAGAPYGGAVFGGKAPTRAGVLTPPFRALAVVQAVVLILLAWVLLARTEVVGIPVIGPEVLAWMTWAVVVFLVLNSAANFTAPHPLERWGMGTVTLVLAIAAIFIALAAPTG